MGDQQEGRSEVYAAHQGLFDQRFTDIIVKTFIGFERSMFDQLSDNDDDDLYETGPVVRISWYGEAAEQLIESVETGYYEIPEGTSIEWSDGTPLPPEPEEY